MRVITAISKDFMKDEMTVDFLLRDQSRDGNIFYVTMKTKINSECRLSSDTELFRFWYNHLN